MKIIRGFIAAAALTCSANAYASNFVEYVFSGQGSGVQATFYPDPMPVERYLPTVFFTASYYVDLDNEYGSLNGVNFTGNGINGYHSTGPQFAEESNVNIFGNMLSATDKVEGSKISYTTNVTAYFDRTDFSFSDIPSVSFFTGGVFFYSYANDGGRASVSGTINSLTVYRVAGPDHPTASFTAVPEPATWAMMLAGFGMIGFAARRRQSVKTAVSYA